MNELSGTVPVGRFQGILLCLGVACALLCQPARALTDISPYATVSVEHNSNVFARPEDEPAFAANGETALGDRILRYLAGVNADFAWSLDRLRLNAEGTKFDYDRFSLLDHEEGKFGGIFDWRLGPVVDGSLDYSQARTMTALADTLSTELELQTDKQASATVRILLTPRWRLDLQPRWHELDTPLQLFPDFGLHETSAAGSINYLGIRKLTAGLRVEYADGSYHGIVAATRYHQTTEQLTADYAVTGLSSFNGSVGYTQRNSSLINPNDVGAEGGAGGVVGKTSALTGELGFRRQLSVKTKLNLRIFRNVDSYVAGANSEIGTGGDIGVSWDPDVKFSFSLHYRQEQDVIQGDLATANFVNRTDRLHSTEFFVKYYATKWLTLRPYASRESRSSNFHEANYTATLVGVDLTARWQ